MTALKSVNIKVFFRFIYLFILLGFLLLSFEYILVFFQFSKDINVEIAVWFSCLFALKMTLEQLSVLFGRAPTTVEYWRFVIISILIAVTTLAIMTRVFETNGNPPHFSGHFWPDGVVILGSTLGLVAFGYSVWGPFKSDDARTIPRKPEQDS
ncbi:hypothetical protein EB232_12095 [Mesorhizobium sp. NZP2077]|nr:hypothetical protein EB232_12095 [Mesorhizobium sp. NZP2077]